MSFKDKIKDVELFKWQNFLTGQPTGYINMGDKYGDFSFQGINPIGHILTGDYDWKKAYQGGKTGSNIGGMWGPIGNLIGGGVGASIGGSWIGDRNESTSGLAAASQGTATDAWAGGNETWKGINTAADLVNLFRLGKGVGGIAGNLGKGGGGNAVDWWNNLGPFKQAGFGSIGLGQILGQGRDEDNSYSLGDLISIFNK